LSWITYEPNLVTVVGILIYCRQDLVFGFALDLKRNF